MSQTGDLPGAEVMRSFVPGSPLVRHLGIELKEIGPGTATLALPFRDSNVTIGNVVHGGAIASLIDTAAMVAAWSDADVPDNMRGTTVGLTVNFLAPADASDMLARAEVIRRGRNLVHVEVDVTTTDGSPVAKGLATYKLG